LVLNQNDFIFPLKFILIWPLAANVNVVAAVAADTLANCRRRAAKFLRVLCLSKEAKLPVVWLLLCSE